jgi:hypothetical protein
MPNLNMEKYSAEILPSTDWELNASASEVRQALDDLLRQEAWPVQYHLDIDVTQRSLSRYTQRAPYITTRRDSAQAWEPNYLGMYWW